MQELTPLWAVDLGVVKDPADQFFDAIGDASCCRGGAPELRPRSRRAPAPAARPTARSRSDAQPVRLTSHFRRATFVNGVDAPTPSHDWHPLYAGGPVSGDPGAGSSRFVTSAEEGISAAVQPPPSAWASRTAAAIRRPRIWIAVTSSVSAIVWTVITLEIRENGGDAQAAVDRMIQATIEEMYSLEEENRFLEVTYANGDKEVLYFKDFSSGAMIESVVRRAKKLALKRYIQLSEKGIKVEDLLNAVREEFKENEDLPNTTNPDDWAKIAGKKGERIVYVKPLMGETKEKQRAVERVINTGQYL
jgi:hypothetical protein